MTMAKETEREEIKEETHELEDEEQDELEEGDLDNEEEWNSQLWRWLESAEHHLICECI